VVSAADPCGRNLDFLDRFVSLYTYFYMRNHCNRQKKIYFWILNDVHVLRKLRDMKLFNLYFSPSIIRTTKSGRMR
jgi:hypothetical protein